MLKHEVESICQQYKIKPAKSKGQNFLIDDGIIRKIIEQADLSSTDRVLEIGPGLGVLTAELLKVSEEVWSVELDSKVINYLKVRFVPELKSKKFKLLEGDALKLNFRAAGLEDFKFKIVANLPYSITSHFFRNFLEYGPKPSEITVMIQKEVAERLTAKPGEMSLLALSAQLFADVEYLFTVQSHCFWPAPAVDSAVVKLKVKKELFTRNASQSDVGGPEVDIKALFRLAKIGFAAKRKQLHNNLAGVLKLEKDEVKKLFVSFGWREDIRAQDLSLADWIRLTKAL